MEAHTEILDSSTQQRELMETDTIPKMNEKKHRARIELDEAEAAFEAAQRRREAARIAFVDAEEEVKKHQLAVPKLVETGEKQKRFLGHLKVLLDGAKVLLLRSVFQRDRFLPFEFFFLLNRYHRSGLCETSLKLLI